MNYALVVNLIINSSIMSAVLVLLLLLAKWIFNKKISAKWHYIIWFALLLRLAVPYMAYSPLNLSDLNTETAVKSSLNAGSGLQASQNIPSIITQTYSTFGNTLHKLINYVDAININYMTIFQVWMLGVILLSLYSFVYNILFWTRVKNGRVFTGQSIIKLLEESKEQLGIQTSISIIQTTGISIPAIFGVTRPWLLIPETVLKSMGLESLRYIILHELAHLKRKDIIINWIALVLQIIHWFNPLVWLAFKKMRIDREMACDEAVLMHLEQKEVMQYGHTLLDMVEIISGRMRYAGIAGILEEKSQIKTRIQKILQFDKMRNKLPVLAIILFVFMGSSIVVNANNLSDLSKQQISNGILMTEPIKGKTQNNKANSNIASDPKINEPIVSPEAMAEEKTEAKTEAKAKTETKPISVDNSGTKTVTSTEGAIRESALSSGKQSDTSAEFAEPFEEDASQSTIENSEEDSEEGIIDLSSTPQQ